VATSPFHQLRQATAPILAVCSTRRENACPQARAFAGKAVGLGSVAEVLPLDKTHGEINALGADPAYTASVERFLERLSPAFASSKSSPARLLTIPGSGPDARGADAEQPEIGRRQRSGQVDRCQADGEQG
jgi:hypothetical protein